jgi:hypothetical protein
MRVAGYDLLLDVLGCGDRRPGAVGDGLTTAVDAGAEVTHDDGLGPCEEVAGLLGGEASSFFLVEEDEGARWKALMLSSGHGGDGVFAAQHLWRDFGGSNLRLGAAVGEDKEAESLGQESRALADPSVMAGAGRVRDPETSEVEVATESGERTVAGVEVTIKADVCLRGLGVGCDREGDKYGEGDDGSQVACHVVRIPASGVCGSGECWGLFTTLAPVGMTCFRYGPWRRIGAGSLLVRDGYRKGSMTTNVDEAVDPRYPVGQCVMPKIVGPEEVAAAVGTIEALPRAMRAAVAGLSVAQIDTPYRPGGWTVRQVVHHVADSHMNAFIRVRLALTEESPLITAYDEKAWAELADSRGPVEVPLGILDGVHARWVVMLNSLNEEQWKREFRHPERGPSSVAVATLLYQWHSRHHTAHITELRRREGW